MRKKKKQQVAKKSDSNHLIKQSKGLRDTDVLLTILKRLERLNIAGYG